MCHGLLELMYKRRDLIRCVVSVKHNADSFKTGFYRWRSHRVDVEFGVTEHVCYLNAAIISRDKKALDGAASHGGNPLQLLLLV